MKKSELKVNLLSHTLSPELVVAVSGKLCYSAVGIDDLLKTQTEDDVNKFLTKLTDIGHESPLEHASFTFAVEGISRACSHQIVRHRIASYSQQSQRYVKLNNTFECIVPPDINADEECYEMFIKAMDSAFESYVQLSIKLKDIYMKNGMDNRSAEKKAIEDARYVLPNACETKLVFTMNTRTLLHFLNKRCCDRSQWEIRALAYKMLAELKKVCPIMFKKAGADCVSKGICNEGNMSCGKLKK